MTMKKRYALFGVLLIGALFLYTLAANRPNWLKTSISKILLSIFRERYSETGLMKNSPTDITASSRPFGFCKRLFSWDTCDPVRNNKSPWFVQRFNASIQPMWPLSQPISQEAFKWWTKLQKSNASYKDLQSTLIQLQKLVPRNTRVLFKKTKMMGECTRCAVIGNSQILSGSGLGKIIDCHDYVFRINLGPVKGFENDVGSLTTHRFIYPASAPSIPSGVGIIFIPFKVEHVLWLENALNTSNNARKSKQMKKLASVDKDKVIIYNPVFLYYIHHKWAERIGLYPSTGLAATMFALHICDKVNLFGFGMDNHGEWRHYWTKHQNTSVVCNHHQNNEAKLLKRLESEGLVHIIKQRQNITGG